MEGKNNIFIDDNHGCKATAMTPQELLKHLKNKGDSTHTAISIYLQKLNTFSQCHVGQDPGVNYKNKQHSDEEEKEEEEREEEEKEVAAALNSYEVSAMSLLSNIETAQQGRSVLFSDEQMLPFEGGKKGFATNIKLGFMRR